VGAAKKIEAFAGQRVVTVSAGDAHNLAITTDGAVWSWGNGFYGQLGHGDEQRQLLPKKVEAFAGRRVVTVSAGAIHKHPQHRPHRRRRSLGDDDPLCSWLATFGGIKEKPEDDHRPWSPLRRARLLTDHNLFLPEGAFGHDCAGVVVVWVTWWSGRLDCAV